MDCPGASPSLAFLWFLFVFGIGVNFMLFGYPMTGIALLASRELQAPTIAANITISIAGNTSDVVYDYPDNEWITQRQNLLSSRAATKLFLLAYMRGGSSILGEMFNLDSRATMWYEPGDAFFCSYYGLSQENLPQNDLYFKNFTRRILDTNEQQSLSDYYTNMLSCGYTELPPEALAHEFLDESTAMDKYVACSKQRQRRISVNACSQTISQICSFKHVEVSRKNKCHIIIQTTHAVMTGNPHKSTQEFVELVRNTLKGSVDPVMLLQVNILRFVRHEHCLQMLNKDNLKCMQIAKDKCKSDNLHVVQVNRMKMEDLEPLIKANPDIYILHYIRDPRAIALSRSKTKHLIWDTRDSSPTREAQFICHRMSEDFRQRQILANKYPGAFMQVKYEDLVRQPVQVANIIYRSLGRPGAPARWPSFAARTMHAKRAGGTFGISVTDPNIAAYHWMHDIPPKQLLKIWEFCGDFLRSINYPESNKLK